MFKAQKVLGSATAACAIAAMTVFVTTSGAAAGIAFSSATAIGQVGSYYRYQDSSVVATDQGGSDNNYGGSAIGTFYGNDAPTGYMAAAPTLYAGDAVCKSAPEAYSNYYTSYWEVDTDGGCGDGKVYWAQGLVWAWNDLTSSYQIYLTTPTPNQNS